MIDPVSFPRLHADSFTQSCISGPQNVLWPLGYVSSPSVFRLSFLSGTVPFTLRTAVLADSFVV